MFIDWEQFVYFALVSAFLWAVGALAAWRNKPPFAFAATSIGLIVFFTYIILLWLSLGHPPLRTMGETRLWYSFFLPLVALILYSRWRYRWVLSFSTLLSFVFICVNIFKPQIHTTTLMPALQSPWFAPHVIVYMFAYAVLGVATLMAVYALVRPSANIERGQLDNLVSVGLAFLTIGMLFGALWAKEAWGHYWTWDPKETWAAITWLSYLIYIHYRRLPHHDQRLALVIIVVAFLLLQMCWWGINYLPSAQGTSVHTYDMNN